jgi:uncharacterized protein YlxP (DUF503 family)
MIVGILVIEILIHTSNSLKEKRYVIQSMKDRLRKKFNISVAELDYQDKWQRSEIGIALIGNQMNFVENSLQQIFNYLDNNESYEIIKYEFNYI